MGASDAAEKPIRTTLAREEGYRFRVRFDQEGMPDLLTYKRVSVLDEPLKVRYKGLFDFEGLYRLMYAWYKSQRYEMQ